MPLEINGITLKKLHNDEYVQFMTDFGEIVQLNNPLLLNVKTHHDAFNAKRAEMDELFALEQGSELTDDLVAADHLRDEYITGIGMVIDGYTRHFDDATAHAAKSLLASLNKYHSPHGIAQESLSSETAIITDIVTDWLNIPDLITYVNKLNLKPWVDELKTANEAFHTIYLNRTQQDAAKPTDNMLGKRVEMNNSYYTLRDKIDANASVNDFADPWNKTINETNQVVTKYTHLISTHPQKKKKEGSN